MSLIKNQIAEEGLISFYKGVSSPLYTVPLLNAVVFGSYSITKAFLVTNNNLLNLTPNQIIFISGFFCGFINSPIVSPIELFKVKL